ncbi:hypothetical protein MMC31_000542 [Peltigera leucophlebia]|nr:hypothetical protein [Peltigera leucophlebia]
MADRFEIPANQSCASYLPEDDDDSDWEYEYHETETETFVVTLDLSSAADSFRPRNVINQRNNSGPAAGSQPLDPPTQDSRETSAKSKSTSIPQRGSVPDSTADIQILDFHAPNPLVSYQSRIYSCSWSTTLGTDLLFLSPPSSPPFFAASRIKLSARPVRLVQNHKSSEPILEKGPVDNGDCATKDISDETPVFQGVTKIKLEKHPTVLRQNQARFLERIMATKATRGDKDQVTIHAKKRYVGTGWRMRRRLEAEEDEDATEAASGGEEYFDNDGDDDDVYDDDDDDDDDEDGDDDNDEAIEAEVLFPPKRRRARREGGGLFRDYKFIPRQGGGSLFRKFESPDPPVQLQLDSIVGKPPAATMST